MKLSQIILAWRRKNWRLGTLVTLAWIVEARRAVTYNEIMKGLDVSHFTATEHADWLCTWGFVIKTNDGPKGDNGKPCCRVAATPQALDILSRQSKSASLPD